MHMNQCTISNAQEEIQVEFLISCRSALEDWVNACVLCAFTLVMYGRKNCMPKDSSLEGVDMW